MDQGPDQGKEPERVSTNISFHLVSLKRTKTWGSKGVKTGILKKRKIRACVFGIMGMIQQMRRYRI